MSERTRRRSAARRNATGAEQGFRCPQKFRELGSISTMPMMTLTLTRFRVARPVSVR